MDQSWLLAPNNYLFVWISIYMCISRSLWINVLLQTDKIFKIHINNIKVNQDFSTEYG